ncbi:hypothetical protein F4779DRAFT_93334 [Xylariaceae sp. FL0662B]|nr:hypothetical protein F4779DRAFT_93334 [Xylariaceae sp. FL0662B]
MSQDNTSATAVSFLIHRMRPDRSRELLLRRRPFPDAVNPSSWSVPHGKCLPDETTADCAIRLVANTLGVSKTKVVLDDWETADVNNMNSGLQLAVFIMSATPQIEYSVDRGRAGGYEFVPLSSVEHVMLGPETRASQAALRELARPVLRLNEDATQKDRPCCFQ